MNAVIVIVLLIMLMLLLFGLGVLATTFFGARKVKKHYTSKQELVSGHRSAAPLNWTGSPKREALQHRRLLAAMTLARATHSAEEAEALGKQSIRIEHELVRAALLRGPTRKQALGTTESLVTSVEELARGAFERSSAAPKIETDLSDLRERLQLLAEAHRELG